MNVTSSGYYTTQYLDKYRIKPHPRNQYKYNNHDQGTTTPRQHATPNTNSHGLNNRFQNDDDEDSHYASEQNTPSFSTKRKPYNSEFKDKQMKPSHSKALPASGSKIPSRSATPNNNSIGSQLVPFSPSTTGVNSHTNSNDSSHTKSNGIQDPSDSPATTKSKQGFNLSPISKLSLGRKDEIEYDPLSDIDDLKEQEITPAQLNIIQNNRRKDEALRRQLERRKRKAERKEREFVANKQPDIIHGKAAMELYRNQRRHSRKDSQFTENYDEDYDDDDYSSFYYDGARDDQSDHRREQSKKRFDYSDYYVKEKAKYEDSPFKQKMYTHKTFKEVFKDKNENMDRYNPIDYVFDNPKDNEANNQNFKSAFRTFQAKLGKSNYNDYDYYAQKKKDDEARQKYRAQQELKQEARVADVFVSNSSDDSDDEALLEFLPDQTKQDMSKNKNYKKLWKRKLKDLKKELGQDYIKSYQENVIGKEKLKQKKDKNRNSMDSNEEAVVESTTVAPVVKSSPKKKTNKLEELDFNDGYNDDLSSSDDEPVSKPPDRGYGPNPNFNPVWKYVLSWLVYEPPPPPPPNYDADEYDTSDFSDVEEDAFAQKKNIEPPTNNASEKKPQSMKSSRSSRKNNVSAKKMKKKKPPLKMNLGGLKKNYKNVLTNWNQPASALFTGDLNALDSERQKEMNSVMANAVAAAAAEGVREDMGDLEETQTKSFKQSMRLLMTTAGQNPQEVELEVPSDFDDEQELYYNPTTGGLDVAPPTSSESMEPGFQLRSFFGSSLAQSSPSKSLKKDDAASTKLQSPTLGSSKLGSPKEILLNVNSLVRHVPLVGPMFSMIDTVRNNFPHLDTAVLIGELLLFTWCLYLATLLVNAICTAVQAVCAPMIAIGRLLNRIM